MKSKIFIVILLGLFSIVSNAQSGLLTKKQITDDIEFLTKSLNEKSSYVYLNGYDFRKDLERYLRTIRDGTSPAEFVFFRTTAIGKISDRYSY